MKQLIVNADDFGLTEAVSIGIAYAHREGIVSSTTLMANGEAFDTAISIGQRAPELGVGVHLNLTAGAPVMPARRIPSLVDRDGRLYLSPGRLLRALLARQIDLSHVESELRGQINKVCQAGIRPTHLDGHKHVHVLPGVSEIVIRLAEEFSIPGVRCPCEVAPKLPALLDSGNSRKAVVKQYLVGRVVAGFARRFAERLATAELFFPTRFYGISQTGFLHLRDLLEILGSLPSGVSELMCHPGYLDGDLVASGTRLLGQREVELRALTAHMVKKLVAWNSIQLISYPPRGAQEQGAAPQLEEALIGNGRIRGGVLEGGSYHD